MKSAADVLKTKADQAVYTITPDDTVSDAAPSPELGRDWWDGSRRALSDPRKRRASRVGAPAGASKSVSGGPVQSGSFLVEVAAPNARRVANGSSTYNWNSGGVMKTDSGFVTRGRRPRWGHLRIASFWTTVCLH